MSVLLLGLLRERPMYGYEILEQAERRSDSALRMKEGTLYPDHESDDTVPWTCREAITPAYAKIIDGVNTVDLKDLQRRPEVSTAAGRGGH